MNGIFLRWLILTVAIIVTSYLLGGIHVSSFFSAFFAAAILGILNAFFRPLLALFNAPSEHIDPGAFYIRHQCDYAYDGFRNNIRICSSWLLVGCFRFPFDQHHKLVSHLIYRQTRNGGLHRLEKCRQ